MYKQAFAWWCFLRDGVSPEQLVRTAAEIGYQGVDLVIPEYWQLVHDHGLTISTMNGHQSIQDGLNRRENHERIENELLANLKLAEKWHIPNLICFSGKRKGLDDPSGIEITAEGLRRVARHAEDAGVTLDLELMNSRVDHLDYQCDHTAWGVQVMKLVDSPRVRLLYDIYHMQIMEGDIIRTIQNNHTWFGHYHTAGNPGRHELDLSQEINYPPIFQAILETGFEGFICHEFVPTVDPLFALKSTFSLGKLSY